MTFKLASVFSIGIALYSGEGGKALSLSLEKGLTSSIQNIHSVSFVLEKPLLAASKDKMIMDYAKKRELMVKTQLEARDIKDKRVLKAMATVPRHLFVPKELQEIAYQDIPLPIGHKQTISQPYIVALMCQSAHLSSDDTVLEVGAGSGYQAVVLGFLVKEVYSIEIVKPLAELAESRIKELGYTNVHVREGDGYHGWPEEGPYDAIFMAAATPELPPPLVDQLKLGGHLIMPLVEKDGEQRLVSLKKTEDGLTEEFTIPVRFVPLTRHPEKKG